MSNMSYCRFQNTASDLADCQEALEALLNPGAEDEDLPLSREELRAAQRLAVTCQNILEMLSEASGIEEMTEADIESVIAEANTVARKGV